MPQTAQVRILVVIPSRLKSDASGALFLRRAVRSVVDQRLSRSVEIEISVGVDPGADTLDLGFGPFVRFFAAHEAMQSAALNAAAKSLNHDFIAFLEDDDTWSDNFLDVALRALESVDFVSSTQLEVNGRGEVVCINDFPTPSGWIIRRDLWESVGGFDESYRFHLDNEWLGRLAESGANRTHLIESTAPLRSELVAILRPRLNFVLTHGGPNIRLRRHRFAVPLVRRLVHPGSGMSQIMTQKTSSAISQAEHKRLIQRYGRLPW
jgi:glycosyltransferase involved in cell wall biosynthesis